MVVAIISQAESAGGRVRDTQIKKNKNREGEGERRDRKERKEEGKRKVHLY